MIPSAPSTRHRGAAAAAALTTACALAAIIVACGGGGAALAPLAGETPSLPEGGSSGGSGGSQNPPPPPFPSVATVNTPDESFDPAQVTIARNGTVTWRATDGHHTIVWDAAAPPGGSAEIDDDPGEDVASRTFPETGTFPYHCTRHENMVGVVIVKDPDASQPETPQTPPPGSGSTSATITTVGAAFDPTTTTIAAGGSVTWRISGAMHNVTFDAAAPTGGNVPNTPSGGTATRTFATPGSYAYQCTLHSGMRGTVVVR